MAQNAKKDFANRHLHVELDPDRQRANEATLAEDLTKAPLVLLSIAAVCALVLLIFASAEAAFGLALYVCIPLAGLLAVGRWLSRREV